MSEFQPTREDVQDCHFWFQLSGYATFAVAVGESSAQVYLTTRQVISHNRQEISQTRKLLFMCVSGELFG